MQEYLTHSEAETEQAGADFARALPDGKVVAMYGELGSGKTAFVRGMARGMGLTCRVSSPTFTIVNEYEGPRELIHFDMYRLGSADAAVSAAAAAMAQGKSDEEVALLAAISTQLGDSLAMIVALRACEKSGGSEAE